MIYINYKTYEQATAEQAVRFSEMMYRVRHETGVEIVPVVQVVDLYRISQIEWEWAWNQHVDSVEYGANSGWLLPEGVKGNGARGVMLNHAERKIRNKNYDLSRVSPLQSSLPREDNFELLKATVDRCRSVGLEIGICADSLEEVEVVANLSPDWIAYEPPELIGSKDLSVSTAKPDVVEKAVQLAGSIRLLIGAGIKTKEDIKIGLRLGAGGFLVASSVVTAEDPEAKLRELVEGYR